MTVPVHIGDPVNARILAVAEDRMEGFFRRPFLELARRTDLEAEEVMARLRAMLEAGAIRRVAQQIRGQKLGEGALVAWRVGEEKLEEAFEWMVGNDPFTGHVVIREAEEGAVGAEYRLWTTVRVPVGWSLDRHVRAVGERIGAEDWLVMRGRKEFLLGVGHVRRRGLEVDAMAAEAVKGREIQVESLSEREWGVVAALKRDLRVEEIVEEPWAGRAKEAGMELEEFCEVAGELAERGVVGRFAVVLEHQKEVEGEIVAPVSGLLMWRVQGGRETEAGGEIGRFAQLSHVYWREAKAELGGAQIFAVAHGRDRAWVRGVKEAIDRHLERMRIGCLYSAVFWSVRSCIRSSEILPGEYVRWWRSMEVEGSGGGGGVRG